MKKILPICIIGVLLLNGFGAVALNSDSEKNNSEFINSETSNYEKLDFTHTVFGEDGTATWCGYCKYAHGALKEIYSEAEFPFYYVTLVSDKNPIAYARALEYNLYGYPTVWFDGGYGVRVGAGSIPSAKSAYISSINTCGNRVVEDIDVDLSVIWLGGTEMEIDVSVDNNEASVYGGRIRVYIAEIESSMGWYDTAGKLYTFPLLDFAFNENISISAGGTWSDSTTWDGSDHGYGSITEDNIMVMAVVFNDEWYQGYSYPPSNNPFDAYYVDDTVGFRVGNNRPPEAPDIDGSTSGNIGEEYNYTFSAVDPDWFDDVYYYIDWGDGNIEEWIGPYDPGEDVIIGHTWSEEGTYSITAKAKDNNDAEGPESTLDVTMPKNKPFKISTLFQRFIEQHPHLFQLINHLIGL